MWEPRTETPTTQLPGTRKEGVPSSASPYLWGQSWRWRLQHTESLLFSNCNFSSSIWRHVSSKPKPCPAFASQANNLSVSTLALAQTSSASYLRWGDGNLPAHLWSVSPSPLLGAFLSHTGGLPGVHQQGSFRKGLSPLKWPLHSDWLNLAGPSWPRSSVPRVSNDPLVWRTNLSF